MWPFDQLEKCTGQFVRCAELYQLYYDEGGTMPFRQFVEEARERFRVDQSGVINHHRIKGTPQRTAYSWGEISRFQPDTPPAYLVGKRSRGCRGGDVEPEALAIDINTARKLAEHSPRVRAILESLGVTE